MDAVVESGRNSVSNPRFSLSVENEQDVVVVVVDSHVQRIVLCN